MHENHTESEKKSIVADHSERLARLETDYINLRDAVEKLAVSVDELTNSLRIIKGHFSTIKWLSVGALGAFILQSLGVVEAIKLVL